MDINETQEKKQLSYARKGIIWGLIGGALYGFVSLFQTLGSSTEPLNSSIGLGLFVVPFVIGCLQDTMASIWMLLMNLKKGKGKEYFRVLRTKPGRLIIVASIFGGMLATASFATGVFLAGPIYPVAISATCPAVGAILSRTFLKEKISLRGWIGVFVCVAGAIIISWMITPGESYPHFYLGIIAAGVSSLAWALEGNLACSCMDFIDPDIAVGIRQFVSAIIFFITLLFISGYNLSAIKLLIATIPTSGFLFLCASGFASGFSCLYYYKSNYACGTARGMALNVTYTLVAAVIAFLFLGSKLTINFIIGLITLIFGVVLIAGNPKELFSLRNIIK
ncbi:DMT family transporter [Treponema primitia]|uniref:DMT family transporter n=1 Tax=Treponema primitia TaxID=88058 RepID=UPI0002554ECC|nr:EamA family transporter [Treponema primitia]